MGHSVGGSGLQYPVWRHTGYTRLPTTAAHSRNDSSYSVLMGEGGKWRESSKTKIALIPHPKPHRRRGHRKGCWILSSQLGCASHWLASSLLGHRQDMGPLLHLLKCCVNLSQSCSWIPSSQAHARESPPQNCSTTDTHSPGRDSTMRLGGSIGESTASSG